MKKILLSLIVLALGVAACANPAAQPQPTETSVPPTVTPPPPTVINENELMARGAAMDALAKALGISMNAVKLISQEAVDWPDGCLGLIYINALCAAVITPGYQVVLEAEGVQVEYHTNADGSVAVAAKTTNLTISEDVQRWVREALANTLGIDYPRVIVLSAEGVDWPDGCLGVVRPGVMCTQALTSGYRVMLKANGEFYEYRTNADGSSIVAAAPTLEMPLQNTINTLAKALGIESTLITVVRLTPVEWPDGCLGVALPNMACTEAITSGAIVILEANGMQYEYHTNADGSVALPATFALTWHREGGIAGFCDDLTVMASGEVFVSSCGGNSVNIQTTLTAEEQTQLRAWLNALGITNVIQKDPDGVADAMATTLSLTGAGQTLAQSADEKDLLTWAQNVYNRARTEAVES